MSPPPFRPSIACNTGRRTQEGPALLNHIVLNFLLCEAFNKCSCRYMHVWHIYSYTWQDSPLLKCPSCPRWPKRGVKRCLVTFMCWLITEWGDGKLPAVGLGQNQVHRINHRRNSFLSYPPADTSMQLWICERKEKRKLLLHYCSHVWEGNPGCDCGSDYDHDDALITSPKISKLISTLCYALQLLDWLPLHVRWCCVFWGQQLKEVKHGQILKARTTS